MDLCICDEDECNKDCDCDYDCDNVATPTLPDTTTTTSSGTDLPPQCFVTGECEGDLIGFLANTVGADECLAACRNTTGCVWFTEYEVRS